MPLSDPKDIERVKQCVKACGMCENHEKYIEIVHHAITNNFELEEALVQAKAAALAALGKESRSPTPSPRSSRSNSVDSESPPSPPPLYYEAFTSVDENDYLRQLNNLQQQRSNQPVAELVRRVKKCQYQDYENFKGYSSADINPRSNQECVLAAFGTAGKMSKQDLARFVRQYENYVTSLPAMITKIAGEIGMRQGNIEELRDVNAQKMAYVQAPAISGGGNHAYCAFGYVPNSKYVIAWDPDNNHRDVKAIPIEFIDESMIFLA